MSNIKQVLLEKLLEKGLSVYGLSKIINIPKSRIYAWTQGRAEPKGEDTLKLVQFFKLVQIPETPKTLKNGTSGNFINEDGSAIKTTAMEDEHNKHIENTPIPKTESGVDITMEVIRNLSRSNVFLAEANRDQTYLLKVHPSNSGVLADRRKEQEISTRIADQLAEQLAGKDLWKTKNEGLLVLGKLLVGYRAEITK